MTTTDTRRPLWHRTWVRVTTSITALALGAGVGAAGAALASPHAVTSRPAANTAPAHPKAKAPKAAPRPAHSTPPPATGAVPARYATDILNAGITAPAAWINSTGQQIVAYWQKGYTVAWTDANVLTPGGIYSYHLATFDQITARDFGVTPPATGIQPAPAVPQSPAPASPQLTNASAVVLQYYQDITDHDWSAAWAIGGDNIAAQNGQTYNSWESGYATTTASITVTDSGTWSDGTVWTDLSATQLDGTVNTYSGTYTVTNGVITSASITQTS